MENKKTFLYITALENLEEDDADLLQNLYEIAPADTEEKIRTVKELFVSSGATDKIREAIQEYTETAFGSIASLSLDEKKERGTPRFWQKPDEPQGIISLSEDVYTVVC